MSTWHMKRLRVGLESPLKCGDRPFGFISRTLAFVPSHIPIMAMAPAGVSLLGLPDKPESYYGIQRFLEKNMRFSPFFLLNSGESGQPLFPFAGSRDMARIEAQFLSSRYGVAIDYPSRGARDARLFEVESIQPVDRYGSNAILEGYVFWRVSDEGDCSLDSECKLNGISLEKLIENSRWGGERNKGYGDISLDASQSVDTVWGVQAILERETPCIRWPKEKQAPFYLCYRKVQAENITGRIQPVVGRIFVPGKGPGQDASEAAIVWSPGWRSTVDITLEMGVKYMFGKP